MLRPLLFCLAVPAGQDVKDNWDELRKRATSTNDGWMSPCPSSGGGSREDMPVEDNGEDAHVPSPEPVSAGPLETPASSHGGHAEALSLDLPAVGDDADDDDDVMVTGETRLENLTVEELQARLATTSEQLKRAKYPSLNAL